MNEPEIQYGRTRRPIFPGDPEWKCPKHFAQDFTEETRPWVPEVGGIVRRFRCLSCGETRDEELHA